MKFIKDSIFTIGNRFALFLFGMISSVILSRYLGPVGKGQWVQLLLPITLLFRLSAMGLAGAQVYCVNNNKMDINKVAGNVLSLSLIISVIALIIYFYIIGYLQNTFFKTVLYKYFIIIAFLLPLELLYLMWQYLFITERRINIFNKLQITRKLIWIIGIILILIISSISFEKVLLIHIVCTIFLVIITFIILKKQGIKLIPIWDINIVKSLLSYGVRAHLGQIFILLNERLDLWLISFFLSPAEAGIYSVALIATRFIQIPDAIGINLFPVMTKENKKSGGILSQRVLRILIALSLAIITVSALLANHLIKFLYGIKFVDAIYPFIILLPLILTNSVGKNCRAYLSGNGLPQLASIASGISLVASLICGFLFIKKWGIVGAAFTATFSSFVYALILFIFYIKVSKLNVFKSLIIQIEDINYFKNAGINLWKKF